jgi:hypothetical protein
VAPSAVLQELGVSGARRLNDDFRSTRCSVEVELNWCTINPLTSEHTLAYLVANWKYRQNSLVKTGDPLPSRECVPHLALGHKVLGRLVSVQGPRELGVN